MRVKVTAHISQPEEGRFRVSVGAEVRDFSDEGQALAFAETTANDVALAKAAEAGAAGCARTRAATSRLLQLKASASSSKASSSPALMAGQRLATDLGN